MLVNVWICLIKKETLFNAKKSRNEHTIAMAKQRDCDDKKAHEDHSKKAADTTVSR